MSKDQQFTLLIAMLSILLTGLGTLLIFLIKGANRWGRTEERLVDLIKSVDKLVENKDKIHDQMYRSIQQDRRESNERLRYVEDRLWRITGSR